MIAFYAKPNTLRLPCCMLVLKWGSNKVKFLRDLILKICIFTLKSSMVILWPTHCSCSLIYGIVRDGIVFIMHFWKVVHFYEIFTRFVCFINTHIHVHTCVNTFNCGRKFENMSTKTYTLGFPTTNGWPKCEYIRVLCMTGYCSSENILGTHYVSSVFKTMFSYKSMSI